MDPISSNVGSKKREKDAVNSVSDTSDTESTGTVVIGKPVLFNSHDLCKQIFALDTEYERALQENVAISHEFDLEKDLKQAKGKYYSDLLEFSEITQSHNKMLRRKNDLKTELYNSMEKIIGGLKTQIDCCKELPALTLSIHESLSSTEEAESLHYRECVDLFAAFANRCIEVYGHEGGEVEKVNTSGQRNTTEISMDCLKVFKFLKERGAYDPYEEKIASTQKSLAEMSVYFDDKQQGIKELENEDEQLDKEFEILREKIWAAEQENLAAMEKVKAEEEAAGETLVKLIQSNMEKQKQYVDIGKRIKFMREKLNELPECEHKLSDLKGKIAEKNESLLLREGANERTKATIDTLNLTIADLKNQTDLIDKNHEKYMQEMQSQTSRMELENRDKQAVLKETIENRDKTREENERSQEKLKKIGDELRAGKEEVRRKKAEKKKNLREKRKLKAELEKEKMMLSFSMKLSAN